MRCNRLAQSSEKQRNSISEKKVINRWTGDRSSRLNYTPLSKMVIVRAMPAVRCWCGVNMQHRIGNSISRLVRLRKHLDNKSTQNSATYLQTRTKNSLIHSTSERDRTRSQVSRPLSSAIFSDKNLSMKLSLYDESDDWEDWFSGAEYENAWVTLEPLNYPALDNPTRTLVQLLQDLNHGINMGLDRPTTLRCNKMIENLSDTSLGGKKLKGRAQRADAILRQMQLFEKIYHRNMSVRLPYELPLPNRDTYFAVLRLYANTSGGAEIPHRCQEIIRQMQQASEDLADLDLRPDVIMWNQVLSAWAKSKHPEKAFQAASLLQELKKDAMEDSSSYGHVLRACAFSNINERSKKLGSEIAIRTWTEFESTDLDSTSYMYVFFLQALQHLDDPNRRSQQVEVAFLKCCQDGMVNSHVLHEFTKSASKGLFQSVVGKVLNNSNAPVPKDAASITQLLQTLPHEWTRNANIKTGWGW